MTKTQQLLTQLVGLDTTSRESNLDLIALVESLLDEHGVPHALVENSDGTKANLLARIGPDVEGGVVLCGHTDCVPVDGQPWTRDPFALHEDGGRLYGRGTSDMKGFLAVVLAMLPTAVAADLQRPILLAFTYDEELGTVGAPSAVAGLIETWARPAAVVIGEPTSMEVVTDHKGVWASTITVEGLDGHSSQPQQAANAIGAAARIAVHIDDLAQRYRQGPQDPRFTPPYTTFNLAQIHGGSATNIVARRCELRWEYRAVPKDDNSVIAEDVERFAREEVVPRLRETVGVGDITVTPRRPTRALQREVDGAAEALARKLSRYEGPSRSVAFGTDGGHFQAAGLSTVVCGPGSIDQAHKPDEWIEVSQLEACEAFVGRLIEQLSH
ncbi:acetylornithine deacetylase [soil metagenome]